MPTKATPLYNECTFVMDADRQSFTLSYGLRPSNVEPLKAAIRASISHFMGKNSGVFITPKESSLASTGGNSVLEVTFVGTQTVPLTSGIIKDFSWTMSADNVISQTARLALETAMNKPMRNASFKL